MTALALVLLGAAAPDSVLLVRTSEPDWVALEDRVVAELQASGFVVNELTAEIDPAADIPAQLKALCQQSGALAALWFHVRADDHVDAWVLDQATAKAVLRTYASPQSGTERARLALRAVELLHASLIEVRLMAPQEQAAVPEAARAAVEKRLVASEETAHWTFGTGVGAVVSSDLRPQPLLELQLGYVFNASLAAEVQVATSVFPARVEGRGGSGADVGAAFLRLMLVWSPLRAGPFTLGPAATAGALLWWASGQTDDVDFEARTTTQLALLLGGGLQMSLRMNEGVRVQLLAVGGVSLPQVRVDVAEEPRAVVGRPIIDVMVRVEFE